MLLLLAALALAAEPAFDALVARLGAADPALRRGAATTLGATGDPRAAAAIVGVVQIEPALVREQYADALAAEDARRAAAVARWGKWCPVGEDQASRTVHAEIQASDAAYADALAALGPLATADLAPLLDHPVARVRRVAAVALADNGDPAALPHLLHAAEDTDAMVRTHAVRGLGARPGATAAAGIVTALAQGYLPTAGAALVAQGPHGVDAAITLLDSPDPNLRTTGLVALGRLGDPRAVPAVERALADPAVRDVAARTLAILAATPPAPVTPAP